MPITKYSTSIDASYRELLLKNCASKRYKWLLNEVLAVIHRDSGQYTALSGYAVSIEDAIVNVQQMHKDRVKP